MVAMHAPECPRCARADTVRLIDEQEDSGIFKPLPRRPARTLVFQCTCGWATTVRIKSVGGEGCADGDDDLSG
jgi:hypothetical protein